MVAWAAYPLVMENRLLGVLAMYAPQPMSQALLDAFASVASQIALGIDRRRSEAALRVAEQRLRHVVSTNPTVLFTAQFEGAVLRTTWLSENVREMTGFMADEASNSEWWLEQIHPDDLPGVTEKFPNELFSRGRTTLKYRFRYRSTGRDSSCLHQSIPIVPSIVTANATHCDDPANGHRSWHSVCQSACDANASIASLRIVVPDGTELGIWRILAGDEGAAVLFPPLAEARHFFGHVVGLIEVEIPRLARMPKTVEVLEQSRMSMMRLRPFDVSFTTELFAVSRDLQGVVLQ